MKIIILAGGSGTRLWPLSRDRLPKQFVKLQGKQLSLFQDTFKRSLLLSSIDEIYVVTNKNYKYLVIDGIEELGYIYNKNNIIVEPESKNTLPAIYAGVSEILKKCNDTVVVFPSDHVISNCHEFITIIKKSKRLAQDSIITFGIKPNKPNTGYGYISPGKKKSNGYKVENFKEKPTLDRAQEYINKGYYWNSGIFMFKTSLFINEVKIYAPDIYDAFDKNDNVIDAFSNINTKISIDYAIMEKSDKVAVVPVNIGWNDLGSFDSFYDVFEKDDNKNITNKQNILINSTNNIIQSYNEKIVATVGIDDLIVIDNKDALLVCKKNQSQHVKSIVNELKKRNDTRVEYNVEDYRPWGKYKVLEEEKNAFKVKRIVVKEGKRLSYQLHYHRSEHWVVVKGTAKVIIDDKEMFVRSGESICFKEGHKHRLENPGKIPLEIIEIQIGQYLEENDIVRFSDEYGRK